MGSEKLLRSLMIVDITKNDDPEFPVQLIYSIYKQTSDQNWPPVLQLAESGSPGPFGVWQTYACIHNLGQNDLDSALEELKARGIHMIFAEKKNDFTWDALASEYFSIEK
jgi:hypothetical protein